MAKDHGPSVGGLTLRRIGLREHPRGNVRKAFASSRVVTIARAGEENRTPVASLEDWGSTIELHPHGDRFYEAISSGRPDSNRRPRAPKARALTKLRYAPYVKHHTTFLNAD